jgi:hypothetical protein
MSMTREKIRRKIKQTEKSEEKVDKNKEEEQMHKPNCVFDLCF